jgi:RNA polymerase sigma factor (sigma-70 family)
MNDVEPESPSRNLADDAPPVDVAAYSAFYRAEIKALANFLLWMGAGVTDAADLAQEAMIDAYRSWPSIQHPRAWVRRVASRKHARRRIDRDETAADLTDDHNPLLRAPADIPVWEQRHEVLRLLATLPWRQRQAMAWSFDGYRPQEIAAELNITPEAARANLKLARRALAARLDQAGKTE